MLLLNMTPAEAYNLLSSALSSKFRLGRIRSFPPADSADSGHSAASPTLPDVSIRLSFSVHYISLLPKPSKASHS